MHNESLEELSVVLNFSILLSAVHGPEILPEHL